jgi:methionyl-tRNA formyltransferase
MRIVMFGLTGFGNKVLRALVASGNTPELIVTRHEKGDFPYYAENNLAKDARLFGINVLYEEEGEEKVGQMNIDLIFICTYHRLLSGGVIKAAPYCFNFHPSLLPKYKGSNPYYWTIRNKEVKTGITVHQVTKDIDGGDILLQESLIISPTETQGSLRRRLADMMAVLSIDVVKIIQNDEPVFQPQVKNSDSSYLCKSIDDEERKIDMELSFEDAWIKLRALSPWPGALIQDKPWVIRNSCKEGEIRSLDCL